jgi:hypothetical protein
VWGHKPDFLKKSGLLDLLGYLSIAVAVILEEMEDCLNRASDRGNSRYYLDNAP